MTTKAFCSCGEGSNLILGTGRKNQTIIFNMCIILKKKLEWKNFYWKKNCQKKACWENNFCQKNICKKKFYWKKNYQKIFYQKVVGVTSVI